MRRAIDVSTLEEGGGCNQMRLQGRVAIITGGSDGIGRATAILFAQEGARIVVADVEAAGGGQTVEAILTNGGQAVFVTCDVARATDCQMLVHRTIQVFGRLDILFNNAGVNCCKTVVDMDEEEWDRTLDVNAKGVYLMSKYAIPYMASNHRGAIVNTASVLGLVGDKNAAAYCASKGAVVLLTKAMAVDHAEDNIRVNCVCPGCVDTPMLQKQMRQMGGIEALMPVYAGKHPLGRIATPEEVAKAALYLASDESSFVTGACLVVDGGRTAV
jgi:NAD(P)-dependent dehydrogenase (short-subunit alcohol dehydrogenase family)